MSSHDILTVDLTRTEKKSDQGGNWRCYVAANEYEQLKGINLVALHCIAAEVDRIDLVSFDSASVCV